MLQKFFEIPNEECTQWSHFLFIKLKKSSTSFFKKNFFISHLQKTGPLETFLTIWRAVCRTKTSAPQKPSPRRQCLPQDLSMRPMPPRSLQVKDQGHPHFLVWPSPRQTWWVHKYLFLNFWKSANLDDLLRTFLHIL